METQAEPQAQPTPAPVTQSPAQVAPTPQEIASPGTPPSQADGGDTVNAAINDFVTRSKQANDAWKRRTTGKDQGDTPAVVNPDFFQKDNPPEGETPPVATEPAIPPPESAPPEAEVKPPEPPKVEPPPQPQAHKYSIRGQEGEYTKAEVEQALEYAVVAQQREKQVAQLYQEIQARENHPDVKMVQLLQSNQDLREKVKAVLAQEDPQGANQHQFAEVNQVNQALLQRLNNLEQAIQQRDQQLNQAVQTRQQEMTRVQQQQMAEKFIHDVNSQIQPMVQSLNLPPEVVDDLGWRAKRAIDAGKLAPTVNDVVGFFKSEFDKYNSIFRSREEQVRNGYIDQKNRAPAPPPPSGGVPTISPAPAKEWGDARSRAKAYLEAFDRMTG